MDRQKSVIRIAIDGNEANVAQRVGSNVYAYELLKQLELITQNSEDIECTVLLAQAAQTNLPKERRGWKYTVVSPKPFWTQWALPIHLFANAHSYDILFTPGHYAPRFSPIPYVSSVMDLAFLEYPQHFKKEDYIKLKKWTEYSVKHACKVIAISEYTKKEVVKKYKVAKKDVIVAYPAVEPIKQKPSENTVRSVQKKFDINSPYILFVGTIQPRKNIETVVRAYELFLKKNKLKYIPQLVLAGKVGWLAQPILDEIHASSAAKHIRLTDFITEREKAALYSGASATVLLGLYEGFGIPPLESLQYSVIPIVSSTTSLPEVVGDAGICVDPTDKKAVADAINRVFRMGASQKAQFRKKAREQVKAFSWQQSAQIVLDTLLSAVKSKSI